MSDIYLGKKVIRIYIFFKFARYKFIHYIHEESYQIQDLPSIVRNFILEKFDNNKNINKVNK